MFEEVSEDGDGLGGEVLEFIEEGGLLGSTGAIDGDGEFGIGADPVVDGGAVDAGTAGGGGDGDAV